MDFNYKHKITGQSLSIKKRYNEIVVCYIDKPYYITDTLLIDVCVCRLENLIETKTIAQLTLF
jgi:hypothetical protein